MNTVKTVYQLNAQATIGQIVSVCNSAEGLLHSIGLKPENHLDKTLRQVCTELKWNEEEVLKWIKKKNHVLDDKFENGTKLPEQIKDFGLAEKCAHFYATYHDTTFELLNDVKEILPRVYKVHGIQDHMLKILDQEFKPFSNRLTLHLKFQRNRFFRQIQKFDSAKNEVSDGVIQGLKKSIDIIREDQTELNKRMGKIETVTHHFELPEHACSTYRIMMKSLESLVKEVKELNRDIEEELIQPISEKLN
ncbi:MAG: hypothetical protein JJU13_15905 [Balneolaceae bacterium]|nr:hypothetical protein [Balneolaceae bacterium]